MPNIPLITARESPLAGAPQSNASPDAFGAGIGRAIQGLGGEVMNHAAVVAQEAQRRRMESEANLTANFDYTKRFLDRANSAEPGAKGFYDATGLDYANSVEQYVGSIQDGAVRTKVRTSLMAKKPAIMADAANHEISAGATQGVLEANTALTTLQNKVRTDPKQFDMALSDGMAVIGARPGVSPEKLVAMKQKFASDLAGSRFETMIEAAKSPAELDTVAKELNTDVWQGRMASDQFDRMTDTINTARTAMSSQRSSEVTALVGGLVARGNDPTKLIPVEELQTLEPLVTQYGTPTQQRQFYETVTRQNTYRTEARLPPAVVRGRIHAENASANDVQYAFVQHELTSTESAAGNKLKAATTIEEATAAGISFERPQGWSADNPRGGHNWAGRLNNAKRLAAGNANAAEEHAMQTFMGMGYTKVQAAGIVGNLVAESDLRPGIVGDGGMSHGVGQWNRERLKNLQAFAQTYKGGDGSAGIDAAGYTRNGAREQILAQQDKMLKTDMMTYWATVPNAPITLSSLDSPEAFKKRGDDAMTMAQYANIANENATPLTQDEVQSMVQTVKNGAADDALQLMASIRNMGPEMSRAAFKQIGQEEPAYEFAASTYDNDNGRTAANIVRGQRRISEDPKTLEVVTSNQTAADLAFNNTAAQALVGLDYRMMNGMRKATTAYYVEASRGNPVFNPDAYGQAVQSVLGGTPGAPAIATVNSEPTLLPPGVSAEQMNVAIDNMTDADWERMSPQGLPPRYLDGDIAPAEDLATEGVLRAIDDAGHYNVEMADGKALVTGRLAPDGRAETYVLFANPEEITKIANANRDTPVAGNNGVPVDRNNADPYAWGAYSKRNKGALDELRGLARGTGVDPFTGQSVQ